MTGDFFTSFDMDMSDRNINLDDYSLLNQQNHQGFLLIY